MSFSSTKADDVDSVPEITEMPQSLNRSRRRSSFVHTLGQALRTTIQRPKSFISGGVRDLALPSPLNSSNREQMSEQAYLKPQFEKINLEPKLLILGSADCGKTTMLKQMKILHSNGFTAIEKANFKKLIRKGIVSYVATLIDMITEYEYRHIIKEFSDLSEFRQRWGDEMTPERLAQLKRAWKDPVIEEKFNSGAHNLPESAEFFIEKIDDIFAEGYEPSNEDILKLRNGTSNINETFFDDIGLHIIDVNGCSSNRSAWLPYFDSITCVLFVASLSSYDQMMLEETGVNRMVDSIVLFQELVNHKQLENKPFILFLNKKDIYERKIKTKNIVDFFPGYKGAPGDPAQGIKYFDSKYRDPNIVEKPVTTHITCCTDTKFMKVILDTVVQTVLEGRLKDAGFAL